MSLQTERASATASSNAPAAALLLTVPVRLRPVPSSDCDRGVRVLWPAEVAAGRFADGFLAGGLRADWWETRQAR
jgi:hypothetical protein